MDFFFLNNLPSDYNVQSGLRPTALDHHCLFLNGQFIHEFGYFIKLQRYHIFLLFLLLQLVISLVL